MRVTIMRVTSVHAREVEEALNEHEGVREAIVSRVPDTV